MSIPDPLTTEERYLHEKERSEIPLLVQPERQFIAKHLLVDRLVSQVQAARAEVDSLKKKHAQSTRFVLAVCDRLGDYGRPHKDPEAAFTQVLNTWEAKDEAARKERDALRAEVERLEYLLPPSAEAMMAERDALKAKAERLHEMRDEDGRAIRTIAGENVQFRAQLATACELLTQRKTRCSLFACENYHDDPDVIEFLAEVAGE